MLVLVGLLTIFQSFAISLGVGSSTLAIINFFAAIADGTIDPTERRMMGIVYVVLRVAMVAILVTSLFLLAYEYHTGVAGALPPIAVAQLTVLGVLFLNATLMTLHRMPSTFGPAIQAGSWYALGTLAALTMIDLTDFSYLVFSLAYATWLVLAIGIVNAIMEWMKQRPKPETPTESTEQ